ncbi:MAG: hypothetical protein K5622_02935 [Endomicrobiaceae bacterium]|nr:hypothetical protein [Endomicrobiaceae bacterium]
MKKNKINIISNVSFLHKFFACVIAFFIMISSICVADIKTDISIVETAKVSADTLFVQFFYISTLPINIISKLFINTEEKTPAAPVNKQERDNAAKETNSSKASFGYSILPNTISLVQVAKAKTVKVFNSLDKVKKARVFACFRNYEFVSIENLLKFNFIMMLLLAILLTRRNIGDDNIIIKIKNNRLARLI